MDDAGFSWLVFAGVVVAALILLAAGLVVYNILKIAVSGRIGQYGTLRAIGAEKGQLYRVVAAEILLLCMAGIPVGLLLGCLSAKGILTAALNQLSLEMFLAGSREQLQALIDANSNGKWGYLLVSAFVTLAFTFLAAAPAARFAAKVSPVTAMTGTRGQMKRKKRETKKIRFLAWGLILFIGLIGILNIINTVYTNIHTRIMEIGIQRAVGMSVGSLFRVFCGKDFIMAGMRRSSEVSPDIWVPYLWRPGRRIPSG